MGYADGIRVFSTSSTGGLSILRWFQGSWRVNVTGLTVAPKSSLTTFGVKNSTGTTNGIYVLATGITGSLLEIVWDRNRDYQNFFVGRTIDPDFKTTQADASIASAYGTPDPYMRVYYLGSGVMEHHARPEGYWDSVWTRMVPSEVPDTPGGAVAGLAWANTDVRVYYMAGGLIHEIGLNVARGWWSVGHIR